MNPFESKSDTIRPIKGGVRSTNPFEQQKANDTKTPEGLYNLAVSAGLKDEADKMVQRSGGESQKYMSGGFIMDVMDVLNTSSYGMVGLVKGKGFLEGVKNRETLSDDDALGKYGWQGKVAGFLGDILLDPLTYVAPMKILTKVPGLSKGIAAAGERMFGKLVIIETGAKQIYKTKDGVEITAKELAEKKTLSEIETITIPGQKTFKREGGWTPLTFLADKFVYGFAADRKYLDGVQKIAGRNNSILGDAEKLFKAMDKLKPGIFDKTISIAADGRTMSTPIKELEIVMKREGLDKEFENVREMYAVRDKLMDRLEELGVLTKETKETHWGTYLKQSYDEYLTAKNQFMGTKSGVTINSKTRLDDLTPEMMQELGQVKDAHVLWATTLVKQVDLVKKAELQKFTADGYSMTTDMLEEYGKLGGKMADLHQFPNDPLKYGALSGKYVSKEIWNTLKGTFEPSKELGENLVLKFKHIKVVWNPASHVRNAFGASIQNWWKLGIGPWRPDVYYQGVKEFKTEGKYLKEMKELGFSERSGYMGELMDNYLTNATIMKKAIGNQITGTKSVAKYLKKVDKAFANAYGHTDNIAKVSAYRHLRTKGLSKEEAYAEAMAATFNYSEVTPFVHQMRRAIWGVPFVTFALKAVPLTAETLAKNPGRISVFGKARNSLFAAAGIEGDQEAEALPEHMRDSMFVMRLPWKDAEGRSMYFDLSYIIPFGSIAGGQFAENPFSLNPVTQLVRELSRNETFTGNRIFRETDDLDKVLMDISIHVGKMGLPTMAVDSLSDGYGRDGKRVDSKRGWEKETGIDANDMGPGERTFYQEAMRTIGIGATPFELNSKESALAYEQKDNLTKLLVDNQIMKSFEMGYVPKEEKELNLLGAQKPIYDKDVPPIGR